MIKIKALILVFSLGLVVGFIALSYKGLGYAKVCMDIKDTEQIEKCLDIFPRLKKDLGRMYQSTRLPIAGQVLDIMNEVEPLMMHREYLLGIKQPTTYIVLLLNDQELRTNGGFMGSYAKIVADKGALEISFQDIYVPDGQISGYIEPPKPIQEAFKTGSHRLPNSDWSPDFPKSAAAIRWFFEKGGESNPDISATLTLESVEEVLKIVGPIEVMEYKVTLSEENIYQWLQDNAEYNFFPGSTQKKDAITAVGNALMKKIETLSWKEQLAIIKVLLRDLNNQNILVSTLDPEVEQVILGKNWGGEYSPLPCPTNGNCQMITTGIVEMNLGANKANCCINRTTFHQLKQEGNNLIHVIDVKFENTSIAEAPIKPEFYGGNYLSYLRFYLPDNAVNVQVSANPSVLSDLGTWPEPYDGVKGKVDIDSVYGFKEVGFFHLTKAKEESLVRISYEILDQKQDELWFAILKQHGLKSSTQYLDILGKKVADDLLNDLIVKVER